ncbi:MAG: SDR family oxidoreductase, partial [Candidatus Bathyarchaeia archaeon]
MNVLVVGGAGYLGGALTSILLRRGCTVKVYDNLLYEDAYRNPVEFCLGDVRDEKRLLANLEWADAVVWLAAIVGDAACALRPDLAVSVNDKAVKTLANSFDRRIVFTSTSSVYGAQEELVDENGPVEPLSLYAATKLGAEKYLEDRDAIIFRLATLFGLSDTYCRLR